MATTKIAIRFEDPVREGDTQLVAAWVASVAPQPYRLWYRIPADVVVDATAATHAFLVSVINQAMAVGRDVEIDGPVSRGLVANLDEYQRVFATWLPRRFRRVDVRGSSCVEDEPYRPERGTVLPFSGGVDSLFSAQTLAENGELAALVTIRGLDRQPPDAGRWSGVMAAARDCARSLGRPSHEAATNWYETASRLPGFLGYFLPTVAAPMLFASRGGAVAAPSSFAYDRLVFPLETTPLTDPLLGRPGFPVRHHGAWARRIDKVAAVARWPEALRHIRPCDAVLSDGTACRRCRKCTQTALLFCGLGLPVPPALGGAAPAGEDIDRLEGTAYSIVALGEAVAAARARGANDPWIDFAERRVAEFGGDPAAVAEIEHLRRRLRYVLGGRARTRLAGAIRRISRAIRGRTGPPDLPALPRWPARSVGGGTGVRPVDEPVFATSARGRRIYVDGDDWRGASLIARGGDLSPTTLRMWRALLASERWTHVIDVGANYGEMLIDVDVEPGARVVAVEPNPHVRRHLERSLREAGLSIEILASAISDQDGRIGLAIDRTWSGMSAVDPDPRDAPGHRVERLEVETSTLRTLLSDGHPDREKRVLVKIDVEGHELAVLRGLGGTASGYAAFAALVEICHLSEHDLATVLRSFEVEIFDEREGAFLPAPDRSAAALRALLARDGVHRQDAVLRPRADAL